MEEKFWQEEEVREEKCCQLRQFKVDKIILKCQFGIFIFRV